ncbi:MAG TPA: tetratricopeptide repeat protein [Candidatus Latescibacteria bacterium]|nr:tetratricopeptide repeat protein [Candidatus Latescibacterota bacterium]
MRASFLSSCVLLGALLFCAGCAGWLERYAIVENSPVVVLYQDADAHAAQQNYPAALGAYREVIRRYPASAYAEASYLRIASIYLDRAAPERGWNGWEGADYAAARDTLMALLQKFPRTQYRQEARNWIKVLDMALEVDSRTEVVRDTVTVQVPVITADTSDSSAAWQSERARLQRTINVVTAERNRFRTQRDTCRAGLERLRAENADLDAQLRRTKSEMERMRRMLVDLERRSGN